MQECLSENKIPSITKFLNITKNKKFSDPQNLKSESPWKIKPTANHLYPLIHYHTILHFDAPGKQTF